jgi:hypothetical protein
VKKIRLNIVEAITEDYQAFDQPCIYGNRVGVHSVYCHHPEAIARKCIYRWCSLEEHEKNECGGFIRNSNYIAED